MSVEMQDKVFKVFINPNSRETICDTNSSPKVPVCSR